MQSACRQPAGGEGHLICICVKLSPNVKQHGGEQLAPFWAAFARAKPQAKSDPSAPPCGEELRGKPIPACNTPPASLALRPRGQSLLGNSAPTAFCTATEAPRRCMDAGSPRKPRLAAMPQCVAIAPAIESNAPRFLRFWRRSGDVNIIKHSCLTNSLPICDAHARQRAG